MRDVEADRIARFERGALREKERKAGEAGFADRVDVGIAGDHVGELGFERRLRHVRIGRFFLRARLHQRERQRGNDDHGRGRGTRARGIRRWMPPPRKRTTSVSSNRSDSAIRKIGPRKSCGSLVR